MIIFDLMIVILLIISITLLSGVKIMINDKYFQFIFLVFLNCIQLLNLIKGYKLGEIGIITMIAISILFLLLFIWGYKRNTYIYSIHNVKEKDILNIIKKYLERKNIKYELSNFAKKGYESKHNLVYWNNQNYYGFGLGASGYIKNIRYENTRSLNKYLKGNYLLEKQKLSLNEKIQNEFILGFRKIKGINKNDFFNKYKIDIKKIKQVNLLLNQNLLLENNTNIYINPKYLYTSNEILINFIDFSLHKH